MTDRSFQYASKLGLRVYAVSSSSSKAELAKSLGATGHIDASATPDLVEHIRSLTITGVGGDGENILIRAIPGGVSRPNTWATKI